MERAEGEISASEKPNAVIARQTLEQAAGKAKADSDVLREESETAKHDAQLAKPEIERLRPEGAKLNAALERLETEKTAAEAKAHTMESVAYGGIVISILLLAIVSYVLFVNRRKATAAKREGVEPGTKPSEVIGDSAVIARSSEGGDSLDTASSIKALYQKAATETRGIAAWDRPSCAVYIFRHFPRNLPVPSQMPTAVSAPLSLTTAAPFRNSISIQEAGFPSVLSAGNEASRLI